MIIKLFYFLGCIRPIQIRHFRPIWPFPNTRFDQNAQWMIRHILPCSHSGRENVGAGCCHGGAAAGDRQVLGNPKVGRSSLVIAENVLNFKLIFNSQTILSSTNLYNSLYVMLFGTFIFRCCTSSIFGSNNSNSWWHFISSSKMS